MRYSEATYGRVFVIRLDDGDVIHETIEAFAQAQGIRAAALVILGGADTGSRLVVGPSQGRGQPIVPLEHVLEGVHEVTGTGTLFPDEEGRPSLHMHIACGRGGAAAAGCIRSGVKAWHVLEIILFELRASSAERRLEPAIGFRLLNP